MCREMGTRLGIVCLKALPEGFLCLQYAHAQVLDSGLNARYVLRDCYTVPAARIIGFLPKLVLRSVLVSIG